jgi:hypothetical protein
MSLLKITLELPLPESLLSGHRPRAAILRGTGGGARSRHADCPSPSSGDDPRNMGAWDSRGKRLKKSPGQLAAHIALLIASILLYTLCLKEPGEKVLRREEYDFSKEWMDLWRN